MAHDLLRRLVRLFASIAVTMLVVAADRSDAEEKTPPRSIDVSSRRPAEDAALERALDQIVSADFRDVPLSKLPVHLKQYQIDAMLDVKSLKDAGISTDMPLSGPRAEKISLRSILNNVFRQSNLDFVNREGRLLITTVDAASTELQAKVYLVEDLLYPEDAPRNQNRDYSSLIDVITNTIFPSSWDEVGGPGSIGAYQGTLLISQTYRTHQAIDHLLSALRENRAQQHKNTGFKSIWVDSPQQIAALDNFRQKASLRADFKFEEVPLSDAVAAVATAFELPLVLDAKALADAGIAHDTSVTAQLEQVSPEDLGDMLLPELDLTITQNGEVIWITTTDVASNELSIVVYPIADLVHPGPLKIGAPKQDFRSLAQMITNSIRPTTWSEVGGPATIEFHPVTSSLVIAQTREVHAEISRLLAGIRELRVPPTAAEAQAVEAERNRRAVQSKAYPVPAGLDGKTVVALIMRLDARSWNRGGRSLQLTNNQIFVRHTGDMHRRVAELLGHGGIRQPEGGGMGGGMMGMGGGMGGMGGGMF